MFYHYDETSFKMLPNHYTILIQQLIDCFRLETKNLDHFVFYDIIGIEQFNMRYLARYAGNES